MVQRIIDFILSPIRIYREKKEFKRRLEELRKRDPFIYK
jgi:hypothetical protein